MSQLKLRNKRINKVFTFGCYIKTHITSGNQEYKKIKTGIMQVPNNPTGIPMKSSEYTFEYIGEWIDGKYQNFELEEVQAVEPPKLQHPKKEVEAPKLEELPQDESGIFIPEEAPKKKATRGRKPKAK